MSDKILIEPSSQREDNKVWVWRYPDPVNVPFKVNFYQEGSETPYIDVPTTYSARFIVKADLRDENTIIDEFFTFGSNSTFLVSLSTDKVNLLRVGKVYHVGVALYDENSEFVRTIIADLPLRFDNTVLSKTVF